MDKLTAFWTEFWSGFRDFSTFSLVVALGIFAFSFGLLLWLFSPSTIAGKYGDMLPRYTSDTGAFATIEAIRISEQNHDIPSVYILGSSTIAQSFGEASLVEAKIRDATSQDWQVHTLATTLQSPLEQAALVETIFAKHTSDSAPKIVVFGAGFNRISWDKERILERWSKRIIGVTPKRTHALAKEFGDNSKRTGSYHWDNRKFILLNGRKALLRLIANRPAERDLAIFALPYITPNNDPERLANRIIASRDNVEYCVAMEKRVLDLVPSEQTAVIYIDEGLLLAPSEALSETKTEVQAVRSEFLGGERVTFQPLFQQANLTPDMFHDPLHLKTGPAQIKVQQMLAEILVQQINARGF